MYKSLMILKFIGDEPRQSPATISKHFDKPTQYIRNTLTTLYELGLVNRQTRGIYTLTDMGLQVLDFNKEMRIR